MVRTILEVVPTWLIIVLAVVSAVVYAVAGMRWFHRRFPALALRGDARLGLDSLHSVCSVLFALSLSLVVVNGYSGMKTTDGIVRSEATSLAQFYRDTRGLSGIAGRLEEEVGAYDRAVVEQEWTTMSTGGQAAAVDAALDTMFETMRTYRPADDSEQVAYREAFGVLNDLVAARRARLSAAAGNVPTPLEVFLLVGGLLIIALAWLYGAPGDRRHELMVGGFAALIAFSIVLALVLAYPFSGAVRVDPGAFQLGVLARFW